MIPQEQADTFINSRKLKESAYVRLLGYSVKYETLAKIIIQEEKMYAQKSNTYSYNRNDKISAKKYLLAFGDDYTVNPFNKREGNKLAVLLFGKTVGNTIADVWDLINNQPYQDSYNKRSFRSKPSKEYLLKKLNYLQSLYYHRTNYSGFFNMNREMDIEKKKE